MFPPSAIKAAKAQVTADKKAYLTSDSSLYIRDRESDISDLIKHCSDNRLKLLDAETETEVETTIKKKK